MRYVATQRALPSGVFRAGIVPMRVTRGFGTLRAAESGKMQIQPVTMTTPPEFTAEQQTVIQQLVGEYDRQRPPVSFATWATANGYGAAVNALRNYLRFVGDAAALAAVDESPPPPELTADQKIAAWDAPTTGGPWALDASGNWFEHKGPQPAGSRVLTVDGRSIYVPAEHPSTRVKESNYGAGSAHEKRWTEQKFRAANKATLGPDAFKNLFHRVAPRGGWGPSGQGFGRAFEGTPDDYEFEGGELYPGLAGGAEAQALADWYGKNSFDNRYGYDRGLTLNWLRVFTGADGYRHYKKFSDAEFSDFANRWYMAAPGYVCPPNHDVGLAISMQAQRSAAQQPERDYSVHYAWIIGPLSQCSPTSSSRRRKALKKVAAIAAVAVGAVFLGPIVVGAIKGGLAKIGLLGGALGKKGGGESSGGIIDTAIKVIPKVLETANAVAAVQAVRNGEVPPPPLNVQGSSFTDYAAAVGENLLQRELQQQQQAVSQQQQDFMREQMRAEIEAIQRGAVAQLPYSPGSVPMYPIPSLGQPMVSTMTAARDDGQTMMKVAGIAAATLLLGALILRA